MATDRQTKVIQAAETAAAPAEGPLCAHVRTRVRTILAFASEEDVVLRAQSRALGEASLNMAKVAAAAGMEAIAEIACGVGAMTEKHRITGVLRVEALRVHLDALALVARGDGGRSTENDLILTKLAAMRAAICIVE